MSISFMKRGMKGGFTLIELLVVIAIIGVLASIVLASLNTARRKSRDARRITDIKQIQLALELYYDAQSPIPQYPNASANIATNCTADFTLSYGLEDLSAGGYIPQVPRDPQGACYRYASRVAPVLTYHLGATLEEATNSALRSDRDCDSVTAESCSTGAAYTGGFNGADATGCTAQANMGCYDVIP